MVPAEIAEPYHEALSRLQSAAPAMPGATCTGCSPSSSGRGGGGGSASSTTCRPRPRASGRCTGRCGPTGARWPSRSSTRAPTSRSTPTCARSHGSPGCSRWSSPGLDARAIVAELRDRMLEELDYRAKPTGSGRSLRRSPAATGSSSRGGGVGAEGAGLGVGRRAWRSARSPGVRPRRRGAGPPRPARAHRRRDAVLLPARVGLLHADPHPGNFLALVDGRLAMIDYGAVAALPDGVPPVLLGILRHVADGEPEPMMRLLRAEGFVAGDVTPEEVLGYLGGVGDPLRVERFHFDRAWMRGQGARIVRDREARRTGVRADAARPAPPGGAGAVRVDEHPRPDRLHGRRARARRAVAARVRDAHAVATRAARAENGTRRVRNRDSPCLKSRLAVTETGLASGSGSVSGRKTRKRVSPGWDCTCTSPWCRVTITR